MGNGKKIIVIKEAKTELVIAVNVEPVAAATSFASKGSIMMMMTAER